MNKAITLFTCLAMIAVSAYPLFELIQTGAIMDLCGVGCAAISMLMTMLIAIILFIATWFDTFR